MNNKIKIAVVILLTSVSLAKSVPPKQYTIFAVAQAKQYLQAEMKKLDLINTDLKRRITELEKKEFKGLADLSIEDRRKLEFLLKQVIAYK